MDDDHAWLSGGMLACAVGWISVSDGDRAIANLILLTLTKAHAETSNAMRTRAVVYRVSRLFTHILTLLTRECGYHAPTLPQAVVLVSRQTSNRPPTGITPGTGVGCQPFVLTSSPDHNYDEGCEGN